MLEDKPIHDDDHDAEDALERAKEEADRRNEAVGGEDARDLAESDIAAPESDRQ